MQKYIIILLSFLSGNTYATADLFCFGTIYTVYIVVGSDADIPDKDDIANVTIIEEKTKSSSEYSYPEILSSEINWINPEEDYSGNNLSIILTNKNGIKSYIKADGKDGELSHLGNIYKLFCEWER